MKILTLNCGSSSVKYQVYNWEQRRVIAKGVVERVTVGDSFIKHLTPGQPELKIDYECPDHREAIKLILTTLLDKEHGTLSDVSDVKAVGHRVVHGGEKFAKSVAPDDPRAYGCTTGCLFRGAGM